MHRLLISLFLLVLCGCAHRNEPLDGPRNAIIYPRPKVDVIRKPGAPVHVLPRERRPVMVGGRSYFEADGIYYVARDGHYIVVPKPR
ncbi:MAG: hypothetical protein ACI8W8_000628 [Rhodothermales bacterium]|jgi:hypothetical protein